MKVQKEASVFYFTHALLLAAKHYMSFLMESGVVAYNLKQDFKILSNRITDLEKKCVRSLEGKESQQWVKEWSERDYEVFASVFGLMADMNEGQRNVLEQFATELSKGMAKAEIAA
jgi:hypothetical protein